MQTASKEKIDDFTRRGWWGQDTLCSLFDDAVAAQPDRLALVDPPDRSTLTDGESCRLTWRDVANRCRDLSAKLFDAGIQADDIVVAQLPNIVEFVELYVALARIGAIVSPVPVQYGRHELSGIAASVEPAAFVATTRLKEQRLLADHASAFDGSMLFAFGDDAPDGAISLDSDGATPAQLSALDEYLDGLETSANDVLTICWTSGTTGTPKGVPRSHNLWTSIARCSGGLAELREGDVLLCPFPFVNMAALGGFLFNWLNQHGTLVLHHPMDLPLFLGQLQQEKVCYTIAPPAVLNALLRDESVLGSLDLSALRAIGSGSAPLSPWMIETYESRHGIAILNNFGSNEGMALASGPRDVPDPEVRGQLFPRFGAGDYTWTNPIAAEVRTRLVDVDTGEEITEPGRPGEMLFWGSTIFDGYWRSPEANAEVFTDDGYFHTGDMFEIAGPGEEAAFYRFVGRAKDIIIRGGMNISPDELDNMLAGHPALVEAAVAGYSDEDLGERVGVVAVAAADAEPGLADVTDFLREQDLAVFKLPERLVLVDALPRNPLGKVLRNELTATLSRSASGGDA